MSVPKKPSTLHIALSTITPFVLGLCATPGTLVIVEHQGLDTAPFILVGWCAILSLSAVWLNWTVFRRTKTLLPFLVAVGVIPLVWVWQRLAFTSFVPRAGFTYGYFLRPEGAKAAFWALTCPFRVSLTVLAVCFIAGLVSAWRGGFRWLLLCVIPWWLTAVLIFSLPSMYLDGQGNASVFI